MDSYTRYITLNKEKYKEKGTAKCGGYVLVDLQTTNEFFASCIMKIAAGYRDITGYGLVVVNARKLGKGLREIVESYYPAKSMSIVSVMLGGFLRNVRKILGTVMRIRKGSDLVSLQIDGMLVGMHIYDFILRKMALPSLHNLTAKQRLFVMMELAYFYGMKRYVERNNIKHMLLPDNAYRGGLTFEISRFCEIPSIVGVDLNGMSMHSYKLADDYRYQCRTPDSSVVDMVENDPACHDRVDKYLTVRTEAGEMQHDVLRAYAPDKHLVCRGDLDSRYDLDPDKKLVLVAAHVFCDAPHATPEMLFQDYEDWLVQTCQCLNNNDQVNVLVKEHPSAGLYGEEGSTKRILEAHNVDVKVIDPNINTKSLFDCVDTLVTCGGTSGMEFPCYGVPVVVAAKPPYYNEAYIRSSDSLEEYCGRLGNIHMYERLSEAEVKRARAILYVIQSVMKVKRDALGLGSQDYYMGCTIDYDRHYRELCQVNDKESAAYKLEKMMKDLMLGSHNNLIDSMKLNNSS